MFTGSNIVVEEFLDGEEASYFALLDGHTCLPLASAQVCILPSTGLLHMHLFSLCILELQFCALHGISNHSFQHNLSEFVLAVGI